MEVGDRGNEAGAERSSGPHRIYGGYVSLEGSARGNMKLAIWSDDPIVPGDPITQKGSSGTDSTRIIILRIGTNTLIRLQLTKDSTDSSSKPPEVQEIAGKPDDLPHLISLPQEW